MADIWEKMANLFITSDGNLMDFDLWKNNGGHMGTPHYIDFSRPVCLQRPLGGHLVVRLLEA
jgi:hypothetical protein